MAEIDVQIRWMITRDKGAVLAIERDSFDQPWSAGDFDDCLRKRNCIGMVAELEGRVIGFMIYEVFKDRLHLLSLAVATPVRRSGVGTQLVEKLKHKVSQTRRSCIALEVRETNLSAQLFYQKLGFRAVGILRDHYLSCQEDAYVFNYHAPHAQSASTNRISQYFAAGDA